MTRTNRVLTALDVQKDQWVTLPSADIVSIPAPFARHFRLLLNRATTTLHAPFEAKDGQRIVIRIEQDGTGSRTLTLGPGWTTVGTAPIASTAGAATYLDGYYDRRNARWEVRGVPNLTATYDPAGTAAAALAARTIATTAPITGGGDLSANRTIAISDLVGDTGSGGTKGAVPAPAAGDAAAGKFLSANGAWAVPAGGGGGLADAYQQITDGTTTATASAADVVKFRSANSLLTVAVGSNDATHGDNVLFTVNQGTFDHGTIAGLADDDHTQYHNDTRGDLRYQPLDTDLTAIAALVSAANKVAYATGAGTWAVADFSAAGRALVDDADASAQRTTLGLGGAAVLSVGTSAGTVAAGDHNHTGVYDAAGSAAAAQSASQPLDTDLTAIAALTSAADKGLQSTGVGTWALFDLTAAGKALLDDANAAAQRTTLGLGTAAVAASGDFAAASHAHAASAITSGTVDTARLGSGTASSANYLRGDQAWVALPVDSPLVYLNTSVPAGNTVANTDVETTFDSQYAITGNTLAAGDLIRLTARGVYSTDAAAPTLIIQIKLEGTTLTATHAVTLTAGLANMAWSLDATIAVFTIGATGTVDTQATLTLATSTTAATPVMVGKTATSTVDTTGTLTAKVTAKWSAADADNSITLRQLGVEIL